MSLEVDATYEDGVLKLDRPLPFDERERVVLRITSKTSHVQEFAGRLKWTGDPAVIRMIAEDDESGIQESP